VATIRDYFENEARASNAVSAFEFAEGVSPYRKIKVEAKISYKQEENSKYWSLFVEGFSDLGFVGALFQNEEILACAFKGEPEQEIGFLGSEERQLLSLFRFTGRVYFYIDALLSEEQKGFIKSLGKNYSFDVVIRDQGYATLENERRTPLAFISHDSRDKDGLVRELAYEMERLLCPVWYDEFSLKPGDNLTPSIDKGIEQAKKCIVILSPSFLSNTGWTAYEFKAIREKDAFNNGSGVMIPVWHGVSVEQVRAYDEGLSGILALNSSDGVRSLAESLVKSIREA
jgi:hypothetical protein